nr:hypothetical protein HmN_000896600 [Hymenolepis microstoma]
MRTLQSNIIGSEQRVKVSTSLDLELRYIEDLGYKLPVTLRLAYSLSNHSHAAHLQGVSYSLTAAEKLKVEED